jgi:hypothetical protein
MKINIVATVIIIVLSVLDSISTWFAVNNHAVELNPIVNIFLSNIYAYFIFSAFKTIMLALITYIYVRTRISMIIFIMIAIIYANAVITNFNNAGLKVIL